MLAQKFRDWEQKPAHKNSYHSQQNYTETREIAGGAVHHANQEESRKSGNKNQTSFVSRLEK